MDQMHEIKFGQLSDGTISLEQQIGVDEPNLIYLHPEQLKFITRRICGMDSATAAKVEDLERKLSILASDIDFIVKDKGIRRDIIGGGSGSEFELLARLDGLWDLAMEFDGCRLMPRVKPELQKAPASDAKGKGVTKPQVAGKNAATNEHGSQMGLAV